MVPAEVGAARIVIGPPLRQRSATPNAQPSILHSCNATQLTWSPLSDRTTHNSRWRRLRPGNGGSVGCASRLSGVDCCQRGTDSGKSGAALTASQGCHSRGTRVPVPFTQAARTAEPSSSKTLRETACDPGSGSPWLLVTDSLDSPSDSSASHNIRAAWANSSGPSRPRALRSATPRSTCAVLGC